MDVSDRIKEDEDEEETQRFRRRSTIFPETTYRCSGVSRKFVTPFIRRLSVEFISFQKKEKVFEYLLAVGPGLLSICS